MNHHCQEPSPLTPLPSGEEKKLLPSPTGGRVGDEGLTRVVKPYLSTCILLALLFLFVACTSASPSTPTPVTGAAALTLTSPAFAALEPIPAKYACGGDEVSVPLEWSGMPEGTKSLALIMDDPDAPVGTWVHWVVYNLPPDTTTLAEGAAKANSAENTLPDGAQHGKNSWQRADYGGPCPPSGQHRYFFRLYALDTTLDLNQPNKDALLKAMEGHIIGQGELVGVYKK